MQSFGRDLWKGNITLEDAVEEQIILKMQFIIFIILLDHEKKTKRKKNHLLGIAQLHFFKEDNGLLMFVKTKYIRWLAADLVLVIILKNHQCQKVLDPSPPRRSVQGRRIKILPTKQMLQKLPILLAQVQADNMSENLLNEICQIVYCIGQNKFQKMYTMFH